ncbi:hypothetical protein ACFL96_06695 [Thermoproteota archaeon]
MTGQALLHHEKDTMKNKRLFIALIVSAFLLAPIVHAGLGDVIPGGFVDVNDVRVKILQGALIVGYTGYNVTLGGEIAVDVDNDGDFESMFISDMGFVFSVNGFCEKHNCVDYDKDFRILSISNDAEPSEINGEYFIEDTDDNGILDQHDYPYNRTYLNINDDGTLLSLTENSMEYNRTLMLSYDGVHHADWQGRVRFASIWFGGLRVEHNTEDYLGFYDDGTRSVLSICSEPPVDPGQPSPTPPSPWAVRLMKLTGRSMQPVTGAQTFDTGSQHCQYRGIAHETTSACADDEFWKATEQACLKTNTLTEERINAGPEEP